jgi:DNA-binding CsgD family transcriptional regulator
LDQAIFELHESRDLNRFRREVPEIVLKLVRRDYFSYTEYQIDPTAPTQVLSDCIESDAVMTAELKRCMADDIMLHPFTEYFLKGGKPTALKLSDFLTQTQLRGSRIYDTHRLWGFDFCMAVPVSAAPGKSAAFGMCDRKKDFTERDRMVFNLLQRHLDQAHRQARQVTVRAEAGVKPLAAYELTPRESEIAGWLAAGKTNPEIAIILGCNARTVEKHVERILEKLGVENRVAAAVLITLAGGRSGP